MVVTALDDKLIKGGEQLLRQLDDAKVTVDAALWFYFADIQGWKLLLSLPEVIGHGPKAAYQAVQEALSKVADLPFSLDDVAVANPDAPLLKLMRITISTGQGISGIRFSNNVVNGQLIQDAYIYRLTRQSHNSSPLKTH